MCVHKKRDRIGRAVLMVLAGAIFAGLIAAQASAQTFVLSQNGKSVGSAKLGWSKSGTGFDINSSADIKMPGLNYKFDETQLLDGGFRLAKVQLKGSVNGTGVSIDTQKNAQQFVLKTDANGNVTSTPLAYHPNAIFMPDFDPAALQTLLNLGAAHNNADLWAIIPKQSGSVAALRVATDADMQGTLDGKPIAVHHFTVTGDAGKTEVFSSPANEILQAEWTDEGFALARNGFRLTPPAKPGAPPPQPPDQPAAQPGAQPAQPAQPQNPAQPQQ
jgi:hypothetical protein